MWRRSVTAKLQQLAAQQHGTPKDAGWVERILSNSAAGPSASRQAYGTVTSKVGQLQALQHQWLAMPGAGPAAQKRASTLLNVLRRAFSSNGGAPKGFKNFYPKGTKQSAKDAKAAPKGSNGSSGGEGKEGGNQPDNNMNMNMSLTVLAGGAFILYQMAMSSGPRTNEVSFQEFKTRLLGQGLVSKLEVSNGNMVRVYTRHDPGAASMDAGVQQGGGSTSGSFNPADLGSSGAGQQQGGQQGGAQYFFLIGSVDSFERKLDEAQRDLGIPPQSFVPVKYISELSLWGTVRDLLPTLLFFGWAYWLLTRQMRGMPGGGGLGDLGRGGRGGGGRGGFFGMVKANIATFDKNAKDKIMFKDVAGCNEAKVEIMEFVDFLKKPEKYKDLGAKIPKGALLVGPPGTGKTLLAKATAGEAGVPFLSISGSDFMEMFVGVGPARVRDLFSQARSQAPSIIFIDEIDAIGRARGRGAMAGGNDERENTLNQLLVEMDGFTTTSGVVVLAGTNRPDILDKALLRPGRFDRTISVDIPDITGREQIFRVHLGKLKLQKKLEQYSERLAALTPGFSGADIANVCNEAALVAARHAKAAVDMVDFETAIDRVIGGLEKKSKVISPEERRTVAYHEAGHAVVGWFLQYAEPLLKVSIVPRGSAALGFAQYLPNENVLLTKEQLLDRVCAALGGRAAEQVMIGRISTGAQNDLEKVTQMAYAQAAVYGMNERIGLVSFPREQQGQSPYSNETARMIDEEVRKFIDTAYTRTVQLLEEKKDLVDQLAKALLDKEVLNLDAVESILGLRPFTSATLQNIDRYRRSSIEADEEEEKEGADGAKEGDKGDAGDGSDEEEARKGLDPGMVVAT